MTFNPLRACALALVFLCAVPTAMAAQGQLRGKVVAEEAGLEGVIVLINETKQIAVTNSAGEFDFGLIPEGRYTLIFTQGNDSTTRENVFVLPGETHELLLEVEWEQGLVESVTIRAAELAAKIVDSPAAVTSVPEEQIEREASHGQLPKVLEFTPGAEVTQSGLYDFNFNTRGFNSSLNRRVSTYIDGRDVGVVLLGAQEWAALSFPLDDLANLEFIRGPSAALYGANASSGVINMTTKSPRESLGGFVRLTGGRGVWGESHQEPNRPVAPPRFDTKAVEFRFSQELSHGWYYKVLGGHRNSGDYTIPRVDTNPSPIFSSLPEYSMFCGQIGETDCLPREKPLFRSQDNRIRYGTVRFDKFFRNSTNNMSFEVGGGTIRGPVFQTGIGRVQVLEARRPYGRFNFRAKHWNVIAHYAERGGDQANLNEALRVNFELISDTKRYGVEAQGNWNFGQGRGRIVVGAAHTEEEVDTTNPETGLQTVVYEPIETDRQAVFSQVDWEFNEHFKVVGAGRIDQNTLHDTQFSPKLAVVYTLNPKHSFRATYNEAFQVANYSEFFLHARLSQFPLLGFQSAICGVVGVDCGVTVDPPVLAVGNDDLDLEETAAWEVGYSGIVKNRAFFTVDYYNSRNENFITDLIPQVGTSLGSPVNPDYGPWVSTVEAETTIFNPMFDPTLTVAQALRNAVEGSVGGNSLGFRLATDLDGSTTVVVARTYANVGKVDTQGIDFGLQWFLGESWKIQTSYSWFDFEILDRNEDVQDILLPNTPEHKGSVGFSYSNGPFASSISARYVDDFRWSAGIFQGDVPAYWTSDFSLSYKINDRLRAGVNIANAFDNVHRQTFGGDLLGRRILTNLDIKW